MSEIQLQPKKHFQTNEKVKKELFTIATSDNFQMVLSYALADFAMKSTPSAEQLTAVRGFIACLLNLSTQQDPLPVFQIKTLDHTQYLQGQSPAQTQPK